MVNTLLASSAVDCGFKPQSDKTKNYKIGLVQSGYHIDLIIQCSLVKPPPSVQSVGWWYNKLGDKLKDIENWKSSDQMKR
jgi:hypothetical protein